MESELLDLHVSKWSRNSFFKFLLLLLRCLESYSIQVRHKQDWGREFILYYARLLYCLNQMLAVMLLNQHRVSLAKTFRPCAPCGAPYGHAVRTWSAVCSEAPHSQFGEGARPHLRMDEWNCPTPVRRRLSLTQAARVKSIPTGLAPVREQKHAAWKHFYSTPLSICNL